MRGLYWDFYASGYRIFPLWRFKGDRCECEQEGCPAIGKHPRASNWQNTPRWDEDQVQTMEDIGHLSSGYGVLCKGLLVIDVDARNGGVASFESLCEAHPEIRGADFVVGTGSGGGSRHVYYSLPEDIALLTHLPEYPGIDFKSSGFVVGPGSRHKSGGTYSALDGSPYDIGQAPEGLINILRKPERHRTDYNGASLDVSHQDICDMLSYVPNDDCHYDDWVKVGMAIHQATGGTGFDLWEQWSQDSGKHEGRDMPKRWHSFGKSANPVTIGTLIYLAEQKGWQMPVTFVAEPEFEIPQEDVGKDGLPFDVSGVDLSSPPGFVGEIAKWIGLQSRRPRAALAVAGALTAMGNIAGLRYIDERDHVTANLFAFCVAGSGTGKESTQQAVAMIHRAAGMAGATHGSIKSEQEIIRNLIRHQASFYVIDEIAHFLRKVKNAQSKGGAAYLDGIIGILMSAYSKADGYMILTGDAKEEMRAALGKEMSQHEKKLEEGENPFSRARVKSISNQLITLDDGLKSPFLSMIGFTTPVDFDDLVDFQSATNGFIGRSLLFTEQDTAPRSRKGFSKAPLGEKMAATVLSIATAGSFDTETAGRVEFMGDRIEVPTERRADEMLEAALDWFEDQAIAHKGTSGLEALYLRAYEIMSKISFILAIPERLRTAEHVRWSFEMVRNDVDYKIRLVTANDKAKDSPVLAMKARIANICSGDGGETLGVIYNRMRGRKRDEVDKVIATMEREKALACEEIPHPFNGKPVKRYRYCA